MRESKVIFQCDTFLGKEGEVGISCGQVIIGIFEPLFYQLALAVFKSKFK